MNYNENDRLELHVLRKAHAATFEAYVQHLTRDQILNLITAHQELEKAKQKVRQLEAQFKALAVH